MRKLICLMIALVMCLCIAAPVFAAEDTFVPSITEKDSPQIVLGKDENGNPVLGNILDENGNVIGHIGEDCLVVTPVSKAETSQLIPDHASDLLLAVYDQLVAGTMQVPYEKFSGSLDPSTMVIRELVDVSWLCSDHPEDIAPKGITISLTFDLGVSSGTEVYVMSYKNNAWNPVVKTTNNGDGTITCVFEDFCPVLFAVRKGVETPPAQTGDNAHLTLWITLAAVAVVGLAAVFVVHYKVAGKNR